jgi:hypothetical protein
LASTVSSVEHKVAMFQVAQQRRRQGRPQWDYTVDGFKDILHDEADIMEKRDRLVALLRRSRWFKKTEDANLADVLDELADVGHPDIDWGEGYDPERHFNDCLTTIYDLADWDRAWLA